MFRLVPRNGGRGEERRSSRHMSLWYATPSAEHACPPRTWDAELLPGIILVAFRRFIGVFRRYTALRIPCNAKTEQSR